MRVNPNPNWADNLNRRVLIKCKHDWCETMVETTVAVANQQGKYCDPCRKEARTITEHNYQMQPHVKKRKRKQERARYKAGKNVGQTDS